MHSNLCESFTNIVKLTVQMMLRRLWFSNSHGSERVSRLHDRKNQLTFSIATFIVWWNTYQRECWWPYQATSIFRELNFQFKLSLHSFLANLPVHYPNPCRVPTPIPMIPYIAYRSYADRTEALDKNCTIICSNYDEWLLSVQIVYLHGMRPYDSRTDSRCQRK